MAEHNLLGKAGEDAAVDYLERHDYVIRHRNWRKGHFELDIVAAKNGELIIVEVKTRSDTDFALPQDAVTPQKIRRTVIAADTYTCASASFAFSKIYCTVSTLSTVGFVFGIASTLVTPPAAAALQPLIISSFSV